MSDSRLRIAVTGGSGRIGRVVVKHLVERGHSVVNIDRKSATDSPARYVYMDLRKREFLQPVLEQCDAVMHLGEIPHAGQVSDDETFAHNTAACATVLQTAADLKLRHVVYTSTCQVYGSWGGPLVAPQRLPMDEDHPTQPQNAYALSKVANELYCRFVAQHAKLRVSIFRLPWVVTRDYDERLVKWLERDKDPHPTEGFGTYIHAADVARAYELAVEKNLEGCQTYHLIAPDVMMRQSIHDLLTRFYPEYPKPPADWPNHRPPVTTERAKQLLGWEPQWSVRGEYKKATGKDLDVS